MQIHSFIGYKITLMLLFVSISGFAQNITLKGKVLDAETDKPVEFANLGIEGSFIGTATDFNGEFELKISEEFSSYTIRISAVGYQNKVMKVNELLGEGVEVKLFQQSYGLDQVEVKAESKRLYGVLKTANNMIKDNYIGAYSSHVYVMQNVGHSQKSEMAIDFADNKGYGNRSYSEAYDSRGYDVKEVRRNFDAQPIKEGILRIDDVLDFDIVRVRGNVLDAGFVDHFKLELLEKTVIDKDSVIAIKYSLENPSFAATGDEQVISYEGVIYISTTSFAVLRNELSVKSKGYNIVGRSSGVSEGGEYNYKVKTNYRKVKGNKYALSKIEYQSEGAAVLDIDWIVYECNPETISAQPSREFYVDKSTNEDFWKRFHIPN